MLADASHLSSLRDSMFSPPCPPCRHPRGLSVVPSLWGFLSPFLSPPFHPSCSQRGLGRRSLSVSLSAHLQPLSIEDGVNRSPGGRGDAVARPHRKPGAHHASAGDDCGLPYHLPRDRRGRSTARPGTYSRTLAPAHTQTPKCRCKLALRVVCRVSRAGKPTGGEFCGMSDFERALV